MTARSRYRSAGVMVLVAVFLAVAVVGDLGGGTAPPRADSIATAPPAPPSPAGEAVAAARRGLAGPRGFDRGRGRGTLDRPYRSVKRLARSLRSGQTGCVQPGRYSHREVAHLRSPGATLRGIGGRRPLVLDPIWIEPSAVGAGVRNLRLTSLDRTYTVPLKVQASRARIAGNRIFGGSNESCVLVGSQNRVSGVTIERNVVRNCGRSGKFDHLLYIEDARRTRIRWNLLIANRGGWAVHLYPNADDSLVEHNVIAESLLRHNVESYYPDGAAPGVNNVVRDNCVYGGARDFGKGGVQLPAKGFLPSANLRVAAPFADPDGDDFRVVTGPCADLLGKWRDVVPGPTRTAPALPPALR